MPEFRKNQTPARQFAGIDAARHAKHDGVSNHSGGGSR